MGKEMNMTKTRDAIMKQVIDFLADNCGYDVRMVASGKIMAPIVNDEGDEGYLTIQFTIPRGKRENGTYTPYDGYKEADAYAADVEAKQAEKEAKRKDKERAEREKERKRVAKQTIKELNSKGLNKMIHEE